MGYMVPRHKNNFRREIIIENNLLEHLEFAKTSDRNKEILIAYVNGSSYKELAEKYNVTKNRIAQIVASVILRTKVYLREQNKDI